VTAIDPVAAIQAAAADAFRAELDALWLSFRAATDAPDQKRNAFDRLIGPLLQRAHDAEAARPAALPFVHGDPRVDSWQLLASGHHPPNVVAAPAGFEPLAAWTPLCPSGAGFMWERPLRHCEVPPAPTEESALAALLTAWDSWPNFRGHHPALLADLTIALQRAGMADEHGALTETARAIVARAAERGRR
jgi:hypothetical protein